jgi:hypothetical protein
MTDFFILAVAVLAAVLLVRALIATWKPVDGDEQEMEGP